MKAKAKSLLRRQPVFILRNGCPNSGNLLLQWWAEVGQPFIQQKYGSRDRGANGRPSKFASPPCLAPPRTLWTA